jgi:hypothetical protein
MLKERNEIKAFNLSNTDAPISSKNSSPNAASEYLKCHISVTGMPHLKKCEVWHSGSLSVAFKVLRCGISNT